MKRYDIINSLIIKHNYQNYLEIGVENPKNCYNKINIKNKTSVDPNPLGPITHTMTSDEYFQNHVGDSMFDIVFIDGLHTMEQVDKDIPNSLKHLNSGGTIVLHDCNPENEMRQMELDDPRRKIRAWNGTVWKSIAKLRLQSNNNLKIFTINTDEGIGVIQRGKQENFKTSAPTNEVLTWEFFEKNNSQLLNLITVEEFSNK